MIVPHRAISKPKGGPIGFVERERAMKCHYKSFCRKEPQLQDIAKLLAHQYPHRMQKLMRQMEAMKGKGGFPRM